MKPTKAVVIYSRVSTQEQARDGVSLAMQRERCTDYARAFGLEVVGAFEDAGASGRSLKRAGVTAALEAVRSRRCALLVYSLDRLTRSLRDLVALVAQVQAGAFELVSVNDSLNTANAAGRLVVHVLGAVVEWQREAGNERVQDSLEHARNTGATLGRLPLGLKRGSARDGAGRLVVELDAPGLELRRRVEQLAAAHRVGDRLERGALGAIAAELNAQGLRTPRGAVWRAETVRRVLSSANMVQMACDRAG